MRPEPAVGIDLGTTRSVVAHLDRDGRPWTIPNAEGDLTTPSVVFFESGQVIVGKEALKATEFEPDHAAQFVKREVGRDFCRRSIDGRRFPPEVVEALILRKLRRDAGRKLGPFTTAVITVPAYFNEPRRKATQDAGRLAGLDVLDIINEPTAAALAYGVQQGFLSVAGGAERRETILVYDLGGGTFDVTLMHIEGHRYNALATDGDVFLGGVDWDRRIVDRVAQEFLARHGVDPRNDETALARLMLEAEDAKRALSVRKEVTVHFSHEGSRLRLPITRAEFETLTADLLDRTQLTVRKVLRESGRGWDEITRLLLVGGSTRMPAVVEMLREESGREPDRSLAPDEAVAHGAAIYAGLLMQQSADSARSASFRLPEEMSVCNVNSHDLGVLGIERETGRRRRSIMIPRNTPLPAEKQKRFTTWEDDQRSVVVAVVEGGDEAGNDATPIGRCVVHNLPPGVAAGSDVDVTFRYRSDGRLSVRAWLPTANRRAEMTIQRASGLSEEQLRDWSRRLDELTGETAGESAEDGQVPSPPSAERPASGTSPAASPLRSGTRRDPDAGSVRVASPEVPPPPSWLTARVSRSGTTPAADEPATEPETPQPATDGSGRSPATGETASDGKPTTGTDTGLKKAGPEILVSDGSVSPAAAEPDRVARRIAELRAAHGIDLETQAGRRELYQRVGVVAVSTLLHTLVLLILWFIVIPREYRPPLFGVLTSQIETIEPEHEMIEVKDQPEVVHKRTNRTEVVNPLLSETDEPFELKFELPDPSRTLPDPRAEGPAPKAPELGFMGGRSEAGKTALLERYGGNAASEAAVIRGLEWLARHQNNDGSWSFDHRRPACKGACTEPGSLQQSHMAATALALMAYLGAGHTFAEGEFQPRVYRGLRYLISQAEVTDEGANFRGRVESNAGMYTQALVTIVLCEALAMNEAARRDMRASRSRPRITYKERRAISNELRYWSQLAVNFIVNAQGPGGGWRYSPGNEGDTSVTGWQVMALTSAVNAGVRVPRKVLARASQFLDFVQAEDGARYGYQAPRTARPSMTAVGLLCRMYLGWKRSHPPLRQGVLHLSAVGPAKDDMYYNYYATQVLHQWGGEEWKKWNAVMRDQLVETQRRDGHADGSWDLADKHGEKGGRLYMTCLAVMTLEVYYRHLPLYQHQEGYGENVE